MQGNIIKLQGEFTDDSLPRYYPNDQWIDKNTEFLIDFGKAKSWPSLGVPNNADVVYNLVEGKPNSVVAKTVSNLLYREGGIESLGVNNNNILMGQSNSDYDLSTLGSPDFLYILWVKREVGFLTTAYQAYFGRGSNTSASGSQIGANTGPTGNTTIEFFISNGTNNQTVTLTQTNKDLLSSLIGGTMQLGFIFENNQLKVGINGVIVEVRNAIATLKPYNPINNRLQLNAGAGGNSQKAIFKRFGCTRLGAGKTASERFLQDYNQNKVRLQVP